jgi:hypothetical protein
MARYEIGERMTEHSGRNRKAEDRADSRNNDTTTDSLHLAEPPRALRAARERVRPFGVEWGG